MNQPTEPTSTENAQIMCTYDVAVTPIIYRYNDAKKGRKAYEALLKAWKLRGGWKYKWQPEKTKAPPQHYDMASDIFDGCIDLDRVISISIVEWPKRGKFYPRIA